MQSGTYGTFGNWTQEQFIAQYPTTHQEEISTATGLSVAQIKLRAKKLGLRKASTRTALTKERLRASHLGYQMPESQREALSRANKASPNVRRGPKHPCWTGGGDTEGRDSPQYKAWRTEVLRLADYTCVDCNRRFGKRSRGYLEAHHIKDWVNYPDLRLVIENGACLCGDCHDLRHGRTPRGPKMKLCDCGCGQSMEAYDSQGRLRHMIRNHSPAKRASASRTRKGMKFPPEWRANISAAHKGLTPWNKGVRKSAIEP